MLFRRAAGFCSIVLLSLLMSACQGLGGGSSAPTPTPTPAGSLNSINHIVLFMQENRSFDTYFGQLNAYRAKQTPPLPQDVDTWTSGTDKTPANVSTPGYDPDTGKAGPPIKAFHNFPNALFGAWFTDDGKAIITLSAFDDHFRIVREDQPRDEEGEVCLSLVELHEPAGRGRLGGRRRLGALVLGVEELEDALGRGHA